MKISILGYSGSGKSTLARLFFEKYNIPVLHFDSIQFLPDWEIRPLEEKRKLTKEFLETHDSWVIDGTYSRLYFDERMENSDKIILLLFNRFSCLYRTYSRYLKYKNTTRPDMAKGCNEKFDFEFFKWVMWLGRSKTAVTRFKNIAKKYPDKVIIIKTQKQLDKFIKTL
jgi:adenylate kinase family enzyme